MDSALEAINRYVDAWLSDLKLRHAEYQQEYLVELIRCANFHMHLINLKPHPSLVQKSYLVTSGIGMLLGAFLPAVEESESDFQIHSPRFNVVNLAESDLIEAGRLYKIQGLAGLEDAGLIRSEKHSDTHFSIHIIGRDLEALERADEDWIVAHNRVLTKSYRDDLDRQLGEWFSSDIKEFIDVDRGQIKIKKFDVNFFGLMKKYAALAWPEYNESHSLPDHALIGNRTFGEWKELSLIASANMMVYRFYALRVHREKIGGWHDLKELLTQYTTEFDGRDFFRASKSPQQDLVPSEVQDAFFLKAEDAKLFCKQAEIPSPYGIRIKDYLLMSQFGVLANPSSFLVNFLGRRFSKDWFSMVNEREAAFQKELEVLFKDKGYIFGKWNLNINTEYGKTDTDAALYESESNCLYIFQLKCPDVWAGNLKQRRNRLSEIVKTGNNWIKKLDWWRSNTPKDEILRQLDLPVQDVDVKAMAIHLIMLSRLDTRISAAQDEYDRRAAWVSWPRLQRLVLDNKTSHPPLSCAWDQLMRKDEIKHLSKGEVVPYHFRGLKIEVHE